MALTRQLRALKRRLREQTFVLLEQEVARLGAENEELRQRLNWAEDAAESWRADAIAALNDAADACGGAPGLTVDGRMVVVPPQGGLHA